MNWFQGEAAGVAGHGLLQNLQWVRVTPLDPLSEVIYLADEELVHGCGQSCRLIDQRTIRK